MQSVLATVGAAFLGSAFVHHVVEPTDLFVTVVDKLTYARRRENVAGLPANRVQLEAGDLTNAR